MTVAHKKAPTAKNVCYNHNNPATAATRGNRFIRLSHPEDAHKTTTLFRMITTTHRTSPASLRKLKKATPVGQYHVRFQRKQSETWRRHIGRWAGSCCRRLKSHAAHIVLDQQATVTILQRQANPALLLCNISPTTLHTPFHFTSDTKQISSKYGLDPTPPHGKASPRRP